MPRKQEVVVTNTPDILTESTADLTWALLLATARRDSEGHGLVQQGAWKGWEPQLLGADVYGRTFGIIGMGRIGQAVARRARGFDMSERLLHSWRKTFPDQPSWKPVGLDAVLTHADFLSLHVPLTEDTHHLIGPRELRLIRPTAYLINVSRGPVVDEAALVEALQEGRSGGSRTRCVRTRTRAPSRSLHADKCRYVTSSWVRYGRDANPHGHDVFGKCTAYGRPTGAEPGGIGSAGA